MMWNHCFWSKTGFSVLGPKIWYKMVWHHCFRQGVLSFVFSYKLARRKKKYAFGTRRIKNKLKINPQTRVTIAFIFFYYFFFKLVFSDQIMATETLVQHVSEVNMGSVRIAVAGVLRQMWHTQNYLQNMMKFF